MKTKRKIFTLLLCGAMLFLLRVQPVFAEGDAQAQNQANENGAVKETMPRAGEIGSGDFGTDSSLHWVLDDSGTLTIIGTGDMPDFQIDSAPWSNHTPIRKVVIEEGVTSIGANAFYNCQSLAEAELPESLTSIGSYAFRLCYSLALMKLPAGVTSIGDRAFSSCPRLTELTFASNPAPALGAGVFDGCYSLTTIHIPAEAAGYDGGNWPADKMVYNVTIQIDGNGTASASPASAKQGAAITLDAVPDSGYHFKEWQVVSGGVTISGNSFTMPAANVTVKAVFEPDGGLTPQPVQYDVTVQATTGGTASASPASAAAGEKIALTAVPDSGYHFKEWQVISGGVTISGNSFTMPAGNVIVKAVFEPDGGSTPQPVQYDVTVNGSYSAASGAGNYEAGATVSIHAGSRSHYRFSGWTSSDGIAFADAGSSSTTFTMPERAVTITAHWTFTGESSGGDSGDSSGSNSGGSAGGSSSGSSGSSSGGNSGIGSGSNSGDSFGGSSGDAAVFTPNSSSAAGSAGQVNQPNAKSPKTGESIGVSTWETENLRILLTVLVLGTVAVIYICRKKIKEKTTA